MTFGLRHRRARTFASTAIAAGIIGSLTTVHAQNADDPGRLEPPDIRTETPLEDEALLDILEGRTHRGYYEFLRKPDGEYAFTEHIYEDGTSLHIRDGVESRGTWRVMSNVVCFTYDDLTGGCFNIYQRANCYYPYALRSQTFVAVLTLDDEVARCEPSVA